ncbi:hypothetical protein MIND_00664800 [Mycena indigotica]|uniref:Uncharacterized protein n=1 Tax=Mycena indigotica TaxID=2126181 RepID=A0A8H6SLH3_9AGAR|nr:uncharacterized protein MIND_00664800 [Mycena indigotica]KAF7301012.1 hypothetical protein MIND_00664800 [Mycena indigotica]
MQVVVITAAVNQVTLDGSNIVNMIVWATLQQVSRPEQCEADYYSPGVTTFPARRVAAVMPSFPHDNVFDSDSSDDLSTRED